jgi:hypothetical protein
VLSWNLVCHGNNTAKIRLSHFKWSLFDALQVKFKHTKVGQQDDTKRKKRHLFSNVFEQFIDFPFLMGLYFLLHYDCLIRGQQLFPGGSKSEAKRISAILHKVLKERKEEVLNMGYNSINDIGVHSIQKGVLMQPFTDAQQTNYVPQTNCLWSNASRTQKLLHSRSKVVQRLSNI